jgi:hypothetical protein
MQFEQAVDVKLVAYRFRKESFDLFFVDAQVGIPQVQKCACRQHKEDGQNPN